MDTLQGMKVFVRVAQRSGFAAAARDLRISPAAVTKHVAALETRVGSRVFDRTTRSISLTEAGRIYLEHCLECLQAFEDADASMSELSKEPKGLLRVTAPLDLGSVAAIAARFMNTYPHVTVDLQMSNRPVDLVEERIDVAVRVAAALDGGYVAQPLALTRVGIFAATAYLRKYGRPGKPEDLEQHRGLVFLEPHPRDEWTFERDGTRVRVKLKGVLTTNSGAALCSAMAEGAGLVAAPSFLARPYLDTGGIELVLLDWKVLPELRVYAVYPHRRFLAPKVRLFVEALRATYGGDGTMDPWWPETLRQTAATKRTTRRSSKRAPICSS